MMSKKAYQNCLIHPVDTLHDTGHLAKGDTFEDAPLNRTSVLPGMANTLLNRVLVDDFVEAFQAVQADDFDVYNTYVHALFAAHDSEINSHVNGLLATYARDLEGKIDQAYLQEKIEQRMTHEAGAEDPEMQMRERNRKEGRRAEVDARVDFIQNTPCCASGHVFAEPPEQASENTVPSYLCLELISRLKSQIASRTKSLKGRETHVIATTPDSKRARHVLKPCAEPCAEPTAKQASLPADSERDKPEAPVTKRSYTPDDDSISAASTPTTSERSPSSHPSAHEQVYLVMLSPSDACSDVASDQALGGLRELQEVFSRRGMRCYLFQPSVRANETASVGTQSNFLLSSSSSLSHPPPSRVLTPPTHAPSSSEREWRALGGAESGEFTDDEACWSRELSGKSLANTSPPSPQPRSLLSPVSPLTDSQERVTKACRGEEEGLCSCNVEPRCADNEPGGGGSRSGGQGGRCAWRADGRGVRHKSLEGEWKRDQRGQLELGHRAALLAQENTTLLGQNAEGVGCPPIFEICPTTSCPAREQTKGAEQARETEREKEREEDLAAQQEMRSGVLTPVNRPAKAAAARPAKAGAATAGASDRRASAGSTGNSGSRSSSRVSVWCGQARWCVVALLTVAAVAATVFLGGGVCLTAVGTVGALELGGKGVGVSVGGPVGGAVWGGALCGGGGGGTGGGGGEGGRWWADGEGDLQIMLSLLKSLAALVYSMLIWLVDLLLGTIVRGSKGSQASQHTQASADQLDLHAPPHAMLRLEPFHLNRPPLTAETRAAAAVMRDMHRRFRLLTAVKAPDIFEAVAAVSEAALVGEAEVLVSARADMDPLSSRVSVLPGWRGWLKWLWGVGGGGRERGEWRGKEVKGAGGRGGAAAGAAASIYYRDDRFFGHAGGHAGGAGGDEANGRACVDVAAWTACVKLHSDMLKCWEELWIGNGGQRGQETCAPETPNAPETRNAASTQPPEAAQRAQVSTQDHRRGASCGSSAGRACSAMLRRYLQWELQSVWHAGSDTPAVLRAHVSHTHARQARSAPGALHFLGPRQESFVDGFSPDPLEEGWGLSEEVLSKLGVAHDATLGAPPHELPPHAALHTPPSDTPPPTPTHPHTHTRTHISPRATPPAAESTATLELHAEVVHQRHEQHNAPSATTPSTHARTHAHTHEHAADASTPAAREEGDRVTSWRTCEGRHAGEGCYRWRRKSVYAVVAWDALGRGHVLARWQRWHQVLYDDVFAP